MIQCCIGTCSNIDNGVNHCPNPATHIENKGRMFLCMDHKRAYERFNPNWYNDFTELAWKSPVVTHTLL